MRPTLLPLHISQLIAGDVVRIQFWGPFTVVNEKPHRAEIRSVQSARPYRNSLIVGYVTKNDFIARIITVDYTPSGRPDDHFVCDILYQRIRVIERQLPGGLVSDNVHRLRIPAYAPVLGVF